LFAFNAFDFIVFKDIPNSHPRAVEYYGNISLGDVEGIESQPNQVVPLDS
jgi:hypothetical protein